MRGKLVSLVYQIDLIWCTMDYCSLMRKKDIMPFVITWMALVGIMLSEIRQRKKYCVIYVGFEKAKLTETEARMVVTSG